MSLLFCMMILLSVILGLMNGRAAEVSGAAISGSAQSVELMLKLLGGICMWSGVMRVADDAGLTEKLSAVFSPILRLLFPGMRPGSPAAKAISMNMAANLMGLGNAATPLGIAAMRELQKSARVAGTATNHMVTFVVLNTASLQLIPATTAMLRMDAGSAHPLDILPGVWIASLVSVVVGVGCAALLRRLWRES